MSDLLISTTTLFLDPLAALIIIWLLLTDHRFRIAPVWHRFGLALCAAGLAAQSYRSFVAFTTGEFPPEIFLPWWVLKDWGLVALAFHYAALRIKRHMASP